MTENIGVLREELGYLFGDLAKLVNLGSIGVRQILPQEFCYTLNKLSTAAEGTLYWARDRALIPHPSERQPRIRDYVEDMRSMDQNDDLLERLYGDFYLLHKKEFEEAYRVERDSLITTGWRDHEMERLGKLEGGAEFE